jgi:hypothetical protein
MMEIPGIAPFSNQPTLTNPLNQDETLKGQQTSAQSTSETQSTATVSEQATTDLNESVVVNQVNETEGTGFNSSNLGATIDITA